MELTKKQVKIPPIHKLRPGWSAVALHTVIYLLRHDFVTAIVATFVVQPLYHRLILQSTYLQRLSDPALFTLVFAVLCHCVPWAFFNGIFLFFDSLHPQYGIEGLRNNALLAPLGRRMAVYKLPRKPQQLPSAALIFSTMLHTAFNHYLVIPVVLYAYLVHTNSCALRAPPPETVIVGFTPEDVVNYMSGRNLKQIPISLVTITSHFLIANVINEMGFYIVHSILHSSPTLYRLFHKKHHMYTGTISIAAEYATPLEEILANAIPTTAYFAFMFFHYTREEASKSSFVTSARAWPLFITWMWARLWETYEVHSGYCFSDTWLGKLGLLHGHRARFHDFHHTHNVCNYGSGLFMDALLNTMDPYLIYRYPDKHPRTTTLREEDLKEPRDLEAGSEAMDQVRACS
ncbi:putative C-4 sterol methyl oxidase [Leishmania infantum JPCM5]|uniref:C-4_sterol_methyl_oxidase_-_putative n=2 Tax=Leishmania infantum TaxID=5671 RepID=A0A6L0XWV3_LEIIN|nr:putative C-4 sterol methyl oxidase [Leishmania infantum JPCM5]CAC9550487.1 C-4_sterol_methyl_oxidase_-_putative [Leishmania infantum]CAM72538.1 putative C-4 sterol methyl oxidase [Leishmania infantum JPCM5]SUZ46641.1 C-4_sterol_methyl_oxidase_-_putative [Leishmania infantum]|eukprot:XP_001469429.1 putative C-4 sterol methyl oxidase [Leishmania infantum JPCM5]